MPERDLHKNSFDEGTNLKLNLLEAYFTSWLPVFLSQKKRQYRINVFDFFCGPGYDKDHTPGSPLKLLQVAESLKENNMNSHAVTLYFNDKDKNKIAQLEATLNNSNYSSFNYCTSSKKFMDAFNQYLPIMSLKNTANFLFIDPNGTIPIEAFDTIVKLKYTDWLLFVASSYVHRFKDQPEFKTRFPGFSINTESISANKAHIEVSRYYKNRAKSIGVNTYISHFSIHKPPNMYGLIFGTNHLSGLYKFVSNCWTADKQSGEANCPLEGDLPEVGQHTLLTSISQSNKIQKFNEYARSKILQHKVSDTKKFFVLCLLKGVMPTKHGKDLLKTMRENNEIEIDKLPPLSYKEIIINNKVFTIKVKK